MAEAWVPPRTAMGGADIGNLYAPMSGERARAVLDTAWQAGIRWFDTAPHYGLGLSERRLGAFLRERPRADVLISTKVGRLLREQPGGPGQTDIANGYAVPADRVRVWDSTPDGVRRSLAESLERLGVDRVDIAFLHDPDESPDPDRALGEGLDALVRLREEGVVDRIGVGSKSAPTLVAAAGSGACDVLMVAGRLTLLEWAAEIPEACLRTGTAVAAAGVYNSGLLATVRPDPSAHYEYAAVGPEVLARATGLAERAAAAGTDLPTAAIQYPLRHRAVGTVVIGADTPERVLQNVRRLDRPIPERAWAALTGRPG